MSDKRKLPQSDADTLAFSSETAAKAVRLAHWSEHLKRMFDTNGGNDPTNPVIQGATPAPHSFLRGLISDVASQGSRLSDNFGLLASLAKTELFKGGLADDRQYQLEQILQLAASLPPSSKALDDLTGALLKVLWENLQHPPLSYLGDEYKYRTADGSNNNILYPHLGAAGSSYARTVTPQTFQPGILPDPGTIFDAIFARGNEPREHPNKISSMLFYLADIIIHDLFRTCEDDYSKLKNSSYLDLSPLYGSNQQDQNSIRLHVDGLLKPDAFAETRVLGFPPGVAALLVCFNRYHNFVAMQLKDINEGGRFDTPRGDDGRRLAKLDNDLFQTARLVTCGLYVNIILNDYVRTILNLNRTNSTWTLDTRKNFTNVFDQHGVPSGVGNQVSVEFNLVYRWHSSISLKDEAWTNDFYAKLLDDRDLATVDEKTLIRALRTWQIDMEAVEPGQRVFGGIQRTASGAFRDSDLVNILTEATEDVACAFGPRQVPVVMRLVEVLGMQQARQWKVATLNEFRKFFKLEPHKQFSDITKDESVARSLETLYTHPDYVELYPGLVAEDAKLPLEPGSGLCPGFTISRTILADAVSLTRGDRFYTVDYTPANLTNWGFNQVKSDPDVAQGCCIYNLLMRALPCWYRGNSVYAMYPFTVPNENREILQKLKKDKDYSFSRPSYLPLPTIIKTWNGVTSVLGDQARFKVPWGPHTYDLTGHDYMLSGDGPREAVQKTFTWDAMYCPVNGLDEVRQFYEDLITQLVEIRSHRIRDEWYQLDAVRDVGNAAHAIFVARMFHIPLTAPGDLKLGITVDQLHLALSVMFAYVFLDLDTARSFKLRVGAKRSSEAVTKLVKLVCEAVKVGKTLHLDTLFSMGSAGQLLQDYGIHLIERLFAGGKSVDEVVSTIIPTIAAAVCTQAQHFGQMLDVFLQDEYKHHWADIQRCAWSNDPEDFERLKKYALEANRLAPAAFGLLRVAAVGSAIHDGDRDVHVRENEQIYTDFVAAGLDETVFPQPKEIDITRDSRLYLHHGYGPHKCLGRPIVEVAMAASLKVFAKLKNLRRATGPQGHLKSTVPAPDPVSDHPQPTPGSIEVFMKEDYSDWWPFPTSMKVHHDGFFASQEEYLAGETGLPHVHSAVEMAEGKIRYHSGGKESVETT